MAIYKTKSALMAAIRKRAQVALKEATVKSYESAQDAMDLFYGRGPGEYYNPRTGTMHESPTMDFDGELSASVYFNDEYSYLYGQGIPTLAIFREAESGNLAGQGGWYERFKKDTEQHIHDAFAKAFG